MLNEQCSIPAHAHSYDVKRVSWTAILVGAFVALGLSFLLNLFSVAIGLSLVSTKEGVTTLAIGGFVGLLIGSIAAMFVSGYAAGYLGKTYCTKRNLGALYGFTTWCVALILLVMFTSHLGRYVVHYTDFVSNPVIAVNDDSRPAVSQEPNAPTVVNVDKAANNLGITTLLVFILFLVGAVSSCVGGHCGMNCSESCNRNNGIN